MPEFSTNSRLKLGSCADDLRRLFESVVKHYDCTVICGYRGEGEQTQAFDAGKSKLKWPDSKHNRYPSTAIDVVPFPIDWNDTERFYHFAGYVQAIADGLKIKIRWGGRFDPKKKFADQTFKDLVHFELIP